nr:MAG TPA: hypothetical protein [Bacteriophage sp.]
MASHLACALACALLTGISRPLSTATHCNTGSIPLTIDKMHNNIALTLYALSVVI